MADSTDVVVGWLVRVERVGVAARRAVWAWGWLLPLVAGVWAWCAGGPGGAELLGELLGALRGAG